jgi:hypothetical protein
VGLLFFPEIIYIIDKSHFIAHSKPVTCNKPNLTIMIALTESLRPTTTDAEKEQEKCRRAADELAFWRKEARFLNRLLQQAIMMQGGLKSPRLERMLTELDNFSTFTVPAVTDALKKHEQNVMLGDALVQEKSCRQLNELLIAAGYQFKGVKVSIFETVESFLSIRIW